MARIRSIHPGLFTDEAFVSCSPLARLLVLGLWTESDDHGVFEWKPVTMKMRLMGADAITSVEPLLAELVANNLIAKEMWGGKAYGLVRNFCIYQRPKKPTFRVELPAALRTYVGLNADGTRPNAQASATGAPDVPPSSTTSSELRPQMKDGEKEVVEGKEESNHIEKPVVVVVAREPEKSASTTTTTKAGDDDPKKSALGTPLPEDWTPGEKEQAAAKSFGMSDAVMQDQVIQFHAYNASRGTFSPDWSATWFRWCSAWKLKQPKEPPRVEVSTTATITNEQWSDAARIWAKEQRWSRQLGPEPGMPTCRCPIPLLQVHGIDPATGMVKAVTS